MIRARFAVLTNLKSIMICDKKIRARDYACPFESGSSDTH